MRKRVLVCMSFLILPIQASDRGFAYTRLQNAAHVADDVDGQNPLYQEVDQEERAPLNPSAYHTYATIGDLGVRSAQASASTASAGSVAGQTARGVSKTDTERSFLRRLFAKRTVVPQASTLIMIPQSEQYIEALETVRDHYKGYMAQVSTLQNEGAKDACAYEDKRSAFCKQYKHLAALAEEISQGTIAKDLQGPRAACALWQGITEQPTRVERLQRLGELRTSYFLLALGLEEFFGIPDSRVQLNQLSIAQLQTLFDKLRRTKDLWVPLIVEGSLPEAVRVREALDILHDQHMRRTMFAFVNMLQSNNTSCQEAACDLLQGRVFSFDESARKAVSLYHGMTHQQSGNVPRRLVNTYNSITSEFYLAQSEKSMVKITCTTVDGCSELKQSLDRQVAFLDKQAAEHMLSSKQQKQLVQLKDTYKRMKL